MRGVPREIEALLSPQVIVENESPTIHACIAFFTMAKSSNWVKLQQGDIQLPWQMYGPYECLKVAQLKQITG